MNLYRLACSSIFFSVFFASSGFSQTNEIPALPEKIYLQLDGKVYTTNQAIWFKAIVADIDHQPTMLSGVLHVDLIGPDESLVEEKLVNLEKGIGTGSFQLFENYETGRYLLRAYTEWNKNFDADFIFQEYLDVFPSSGLEGHSPIEDLSLVEKEKDIFRITATLNPVLLDSLHRGNLKVYLTLDGKKDSITVRKNNRESYLLDYELPPKTHIVTVSIKPSDIKSYTKTFSFNTDGIDLQFFPEGGELIHGFTSRIGFKVLNYAGKGKTVEGVIADAEGHVIADFKSNALGMGSFFLMADSSKSYHAILKDHPAEKYPLPRSKSKGWVLSVRKPGGNFTIAVASNVQQLDSVYIRLSCRDREYGFLKVRMRDGGFLWSPDKASLPEGIITFTLLDKNRKPVAERLFFNERQDTRADLRLHADKNVYVQREKTTVTVKVNDIGFNEKADLSILVINKEQMGPLQSTRENILSYFLLSSDLKGEIENPGYYFRKENVNRLIDLDALMLTQGWRKFRHNESEKQFQPEYDLSISGSVAGVFSKKNKKEGVVLKLMMSDDILMPSQTTDSLGRFRFDLADRYGEKRLNFFVKSANQNGEDKDYQILLDEKSSPAISYRQSPETIDSVVTLLVKKHQERKLIDDTNRLSGVNYLDEVKVTAARMTPEKEKVTDLYGEADIVIDGEAIRAREEKWSFGLYSVLMHYFPKDINIRRVRSRNESYLFAEIIGRGLTLIVIDGITVLFTDFPNVPNIAPSEVRSFELIKMPKNYGKVYLETFPSAWQVPPRGSIIAIYTYAGKGLAGTQKTIGLSEMSIPIFAPVREFYSPNYEKLAPEDWVKPDRRALIHWSPQVNTDDEGEATISFYNADVTGDVMVVVEAITDHGRIGYQEMVYRVKKK